MLAVDGECVYNGSNINEQREIYMPIINRDYLAILRGIAKDNDELHEKKADGRCSLGVGCGVYGACYAKENGRPEMCGSSDTVEEVRREDKLK